MGERNSKPSSIIALITVNLFPVFGVLYWGWSVFPIMLLFWAENVIVGFYNVLRMIAFRPREGAAWLVKLFLIPFFTIHYGGFTAGHGMFVVLMFGQDLFESTAGPRLDILLQVVRDYNLMYAILALFISHGYSFITNYLGKKEYLRYDLTKLMMLPYGRIVLMHITLVIGGLIIAILDSPTAGLYLFILLKIIMDLRAHIREHKDDPASVRSRYRTSR